jgi:hypothetical protein
VHWEEPDRVAADIGRFVAQMEELA